jgi:hypothetical protein
MGHPGHGDKGRTYRAHVYCVHCALLLLYTAHVQRAAQTPKTPRGRPRAGPARASWGPGPGRQGLYFILNHALWRCCRA